MRVRHRPGFESEKKFLRVWRQREKQIEEKGAIDRQVFPPREGDEQLADGDGVGCQRLFGHFERTANHEFACVEGEAHGKGVS